MARRTSNARRAVVYARLSVTTEESVSIERQLDAGRKYAEARGWVVVAEAIDDGVSATKNKPEDRAGWRSVLGLAEPFDVVIVWKVDRLARRALDFLNADAALRQRGAGLVAVEDPIDMTTSQGRAFATMLAVFAEMEAESIRARVRDAHRALVHQGRRTGGRPPFGFVNIKNPAGPGFVLAHDPERIDVVRELVARALDGASLYSLARWLESEGIEPRGRKGRSTAGWHEASVETILRAPALAGMTPYRAVVPKDANDRPLPRKDSDVLRDADGLPVIDEGIAIITPAERRQLLAVLDAAKLPGTRQRAGAEPALLYGLARCASCGGLLHRATAAGKYRQYRCAARACPRHVGINRDALEAHVVEEFLAKVGRLPVVRFIESDEEPDTTSLADVEAAISETLAALAEDDADVPALTERLATLKAARTSARAAVESTPTIVATSTGETFAEAWASLSDDIEARRQLLLSGIEAVEVGPGGGRGRTFDADRVDIVWRIAIDD